MLNAWLSEARLYNSMERITLDVDVGHFGLRHLDTLGISVGVEFAANRQTGLCCSCGDQLHNGQAACQRPAAPVLCDVAEHAVLYSVPFRCTRRIVAYHNGQPCGIGKLL